jgi:hypothetical protein
MGLSGYTFLNVKDQMVSCMNAKICEAIDSQRILKFRYKGHKRVVEPFCHGRSQKGKETLRAYQVKGGSTSGRVPDWKFFTVAKMQGIEIKDEEFEGNRPRYNPNDKDMRSMCCNV